MTSVTLRSGEVRESGYDKHPNYRVWLEPSPKRVRVRYNGHVLVDSVHARLLYETRHVPVYYFPREDVDWACLSPTSHSTFCPFKGEAAYWSIRVGDQNQDNVVWGYPQPLEEVQGLDAYFALYWDKMDQWLEEDEEVFVHPRDPYVRLDALASTREVEVRIAGETVAMSRNAVFLFETGLPVRYYLPISDVRMDFLVPSETVTRCPYKGTARHYNAIVSGQELKDAAWLYESPVHEAEPIAGHICFYGERVEKITIDGETVETPRTKWST
ncbi:MAG: hypothetical protein ACI8PT_002743 [Gammaproteobacteria bacterium]|jgi:uncharacterized protein (DUF427 family)